MSVNIKVTGGLNIEWGQIDPKGNRRVKETKCIDDGGCVCMSVCMYMDLNWFPGKGKKERKKKMNYDELTNQ